MRAMPPPSPQYYRGADKSFAYPTEKTINRSPFFVWCGGHCCCGDLVGRTNFWFLFFWVTCKSLVAVACFLPCRAKDLSSPGIFDLIALITKREITELLRLQWQAWKMKDKSWQIQTVHRTTRWDGWYHWHRLDEEEIYTTSESGTQSSERQEKEMTIKYG